MVMAMCRKEPEHGSPRQIPENYLCRRITSLRWVRASYRLNDRHFLWYSWRLSQLCGSFASSQRSWSALASARAKALERVFLACFPTTITLPLSTLTTRSPGLMDVPCAARAIRTPLNPVGYRPDGRSLIRRAVFRSSLGFRRPLRTSAPSSSAPHRPTLSPSPPPSIPSLPLPSPLLGAVVAVAPVEVLPSLQAVCGNKVGFGVQSPASRGTLGLGTAGCLEASWTTPSAVLWSPT